MQSLIINQQITNKLSISLIFLYFYLTQSNSFFTFKNLSTFTIQTLQTFTNYSFFSLYTFLNSSLLSSTQIIYHKTSNSQDYHLTGTTSYLSHTIMYLIINSLISFNFTSLIYIDNIFFFSSLSSSHCIFYTNKIKITITFTYWCLKSPFYILSHQLTLLKNTLHLVNSSLSKTQTIL
jgi:hypothetical protein